jgi:hypothetical protein
LWRQNIEILGRVFGERLWDKNSRVVDQNIDAAVSGYGGIHDLCGRLRLTDVSINECKNPQTPGTDLLW